MELVEHRNRTWGHPEVQDHARLAAGRPDHGRLDRRGVRHHENVLVTSALDHLAARFGHARVNGPERLATIRFIGDVGSPPAIEFSDHVGKFSAFELAERDLPPAVVDLVGLGVEPGDGGGLTGASERTGHHRVDVPSFADVGPGPRCLFEAEIVEGRVGFALQDRRRVVGGTSVAQEDEHARSLPRPSGPASNSTAESNLFRIVEQRRNRVRWRPMSVQSIERAFTLLRALAVGPAGVTDLADKVDLPKSTVARLLSALETERAVTQDEIGGDYRLGEGLLDIAGATQPGRNLVATARPHLLDLTERAGETSGISVADGRNMYYLDHAEAESEIQVRDWTGESSPIHTVPSGLVVMAYWSERKLDAFLRSDLTRTTPWTVTDPDEIRSRLEQVRSLGYAWVYEEFAEGINSVAAPIFEADGTVEAAVHIHGPAYRFPDPDRSHDLGIMVIDAASSVADHLASE